MNRHVLYFVMAAWAVSCAALAAESAAEPAQPSSVNVTATVNGKIISSDTSATVHSSQPHGAPPRIIKNDTASPPVIVIPRLDLPNQRPGSRQ